MKKNILFNLIYGAALTAFTLWLLLDTFLISSVYAPNVQEPSKERPQAEIITTSEEYEDQNISIQLKEYRLKETTVYLADVKISSKEYLKTALAENSYGKNITQKTSELAKEKGAILAINGDFYGAREKGYVLRDGVLYRSKKAKNQEDLVIYDDGSFAIIDESKVPAKDLLEYGAEQVFSFGPGLVDQGQIIVDPSDEVGRSMADNPRTAIGMVSDLHYLFVVSDGRTNESKGLSLYELAEFMQEQGALIAYNLDGGGSSTMYFNGEIINFPTTNGTFKERSVSDIVYIGY